MFTTCQLTISKLLWKDKEEKNKDHSVQSNTVLTVDVLSKDITEDDYIRARTEVATKNGCDDAFYVMNIDQLISRYKLWMNKLPNIKPFYAVKSNNDPVFLSLLANLGVRFDCASKREIEQILELGVTPDNIIFAHPCKQVSHIRYARDKGVSMMVFDNEEELIKTAAEYKDARLLLRIRYDDPASTAPMGNKYGTTIPEACQLVDVAKRLDLTVIGVCFHLGFGFKSGEAFNTAIEMCHEVIQYATSVGYHMTVLDIGGGYPGCERDLLRFDEVSTVVNNSIQRLFPDRTKDDLTIIAEPGQYFSQSCFSLVVQVVSKRHTSSDCYYYVNDGIFGSMLRWAFSTDHTTPPRCLKRDSHTTDLIPCTIWGPVLAPVDKICDTVLPELNVGEWLVFNELGAYSLSVHSGFNGFDKPKVFWYTTTGTH